jgi:hypothetical protein
MVSKPRGNKDKKLMCVYVDPETVKRLKIKCIEDGVSMTSVVEDLIKKHVGG